MQSRPHAEQYQFKLTYVLVQFRVSDRFNLNQFSDTRFKAGALKAHSRGLRSRLEGWLCQRMQAARSGAPTLIYPRPSLAPATPAGWPLAVTGQLLGSSVAR
jgi:hypothetical protein